MIRRFLSSTRGATAIEYALIAGLIFFAILVAIEPIGQTLSGIFGQASDGMQQQP